jgi:prepilin-type N-terminal cleavage/methylation domain-containing protein
MKRHYASGQGFTLIELLVALAIVSLVAILSWQGLDNVIRLTQRVRDRDDQWEQLRATMAQLEKDLRAVHNPRASNAALNRSGTGTAGGTGGTGTTTPGAGNAGSEMSGRQRATGRDDVVIEDDDNLDAVVNAVLANTQRVQLKAGALEIISSQASAREGPMSLQVRWPFINGQWRREQINLTSRPDAPSGALAGGSGTGASTGNGVMLSPAQRALFEEPGLRLRGVGVRVWIEGRGWDNEQFLGEALPPETLPNPGAAAGMTSSGSLPNPNPLGGTPVNGTSSGQASGSAAPGPMRLRGVRVRLWMPSGDIYTRVFMLGQES